MAGVALLLLSLPTAALGHELYRTSHMPAQDSVPVSNYSYTGLTGPLNWYALSESANVLCDRGRTQSPINIDSSIATMPGSAVSLSIPDHKKVVFENIGTYVEVVINGTMTFDGKKYSLQQFHYHTPSEHRVNFEYFPMEQHIVAEAADGTTAVLAFLLELSSNGRTGPLQRSVLPHVAKIPNPGDSTTIGPLKFGPLIRHLHANDIYTYVGSLTSPPCTQNFRWLICTKPISISVEPFLASKKVLKFNSRYTQNYLGGENLIAHAAHELNK